MTNVKPAKHYGAFASSIKVSSSGFKSSGLIIWPQVGLNSFGRPVEARIPAIFNKIHDWCYLMSVRFEF